jgi:hypothetical protein
VSRLIRLEWPDHGTPDVPPPLSLIECDQRLSALRAQAKGRGYDVLAIYGDREHAANLHWLTGFDPRFEEAVLLVRQGDALLLAGNECLAYTAVSPLVAAGQLRTGLCSSLSLPSQPRGGQRLGDWLQTMVGVGDVVGAIGWKWFGADEVEDPATALDIPAFLADPLRRLAARVENATDLMMHPAHGLRCRVDVAEISRLEFANHMAAAALRRLAFALRPGMTDFQAVEAARIGGLPLGCHVTFATGSAPGLCGPSGARLTTGEPASFNVAHWGSNICRAGWLARTAADLPPAAQDYLEAFVEPYVSAMSDWCEMMQPGIAGGQVWDHMMTALPEERFGVTLNPGHLIGLDEWVSSPIRQGSSDLLASGMAMQMDVIPTHPVYSSTRMEDGYVIADAALRRNLEQDFPNVARRCASRARFLREVIGMKIPDDLLPLADTCGIVAPFLFDPAQVVVC